MVYSFLYCLKASLCYCVIRRHGKWFGLTLLWVVGSTDTPVNELMLYWNSNQTIFHSSLITKQIAKESDHNTSKKIWLVDMFSSHITWCEGDTKISLAGTSIRAKRHKELLSTFSQDPLLLILSEVIIYYAEFIKLSLIPAFSSNEEKCTFGSLTFCNMFI